MCPGKLFLAGFASEEVDGLPNLTATRREVLLSSHDGRRSSFRSLLIEDQVEPLILPAQAPVHSADSTLISPRL